MRTKSLPPAPVIRPMFRRRPNCLKSVKSKPLPSVQNEGARRQPLRRFLRYVWPYNGIIVMATLCGMMKFILPSSMALTFKFLTDRLVGTLEGGKHAASGGKDDIIVRSIDAYL